MERVFIVFDSRQDEAAGLLALARHTRVDALPHGIYSIQPDDLKWLDAAELRYRTATDDEVKSATEGVRDPVAASVQ